MKTNIIKLFAVVAVFGLGSLCITSCHSTKKTVTERVVVLDDQEVPLTDWVKCSSCAGKGECNRCKGTGKVGMQKCVTCAGTGKCTVCGGEGGYRSR